MEILLIIVPALLLFFLVQNEKAATLISKVVLSLVSVVFLYMLWVNESVTFFQMLAGTTIFVIATFLTYLFVSAVMKELWADMYFGHNGGIFESKVFATLAAFLVPIILGPIAGFFSSAMYLGENGINFKSVEPALEASTSLPETAPEADAQPETQTIEGSLLRYISTGWRIPNENDYKEDWAEFKNDAPTPYLLSGDFNGDSLGDTAYILLNDEKSQWAVAVYFKKENGVYRERFLEKWSVNDRSPFFVQLAEAKPGIHKTACGKGYMDCDENQLKEVDLRNDGIILTPYESGGAVLLYLDAGLFEKVLLND